MTKQATKFIFERYSYDSATNRASFEYAIEFADASRETYIETFTFHDASPEDWEKIPAQLLDRLLQNLHLVLGLSYWKMYCPREIAINGFSLSHSQADFWNMVYTKGMGEFFYRNKIDFRGLVKFPAALSTDLPVISFSRTDRSLVPIGGGKDSVVTVELLKQFQKSFDAFSLGGSHVQDRMIERMEVKSIRVERALDVRMVEKSKSGETYNGHVPISAIYTFVSVLVAALHDYRYCIFSNEHSANFGNVLHFGMEVNHQWSKSLEFELASRAYLHTFVTPDITPFSLLRPLHEIDIVRRFVAYPRYFSLFSSCNRNFVVAQDQPRREDGAYWCGECPKCAFVFALLAAFIKKERLSLSIFGKDLFADSHLLPLFKALTGKEALKPFECVGTPEEMIVALYRAHKDGSYHGDVVIQWFEKEILPTIEKDIETFERNVFTPQQLISLPESFRPLIQETYESA